MLWKQRSLSHGLQNFSALSAIRIMTIFVFSNSGKLDQVCDINLIKVIHLSGKWIIKWASAPAGGRRADWKAMSTHAELSALRQGRRLPELYWSDDSLSILSGQLTTAPTNWIACTLPPEWTRCRARASRPTLRTKWRHDTQTSSLLSTASLWSDKKSYLVDKCTYSILSVSVYSIIKCNSE